MTDPRDMVTLHQTVITDDEAQFSGDVETPFVELVDQAAAPTATTDKSSVLLYALASDNSLRMKKQTGVETNISGLLSSFGGGVAPAHSDADHTAPYVPLTTDYIIGADSLGGAVAVNLAALAGYADNKVLIIKDEGGNAGVAAITVTPNGGDFIDGVNAPVVINVAYAVLRLYKRAGGWFTW